MDILPGPHVDHVGDCRKMPFPDRSFNLIYASHVLEHVPWYQVADTLLEWHRVLKDDGTLEVFTVDGLKIAKALVDLEENNVSPIHHDNWTRFNEKRNPYLWIAGRIFAYAKTSKANDPNWHHCLFTPRFLQQSLIEAGFKSVQLLNRDRVRGPDHGWINLGACGIA